MDGFLGKSAGKHGEAMVTIDLFSLKLIRGLLQMFPRKPIGIGASTDFLCFSDVGS
jgi:hypothetical protein